jgi:hypothetical protein
MRRCQLTKQDQERIILLYERDGVDTRGLAVRFDRSIGAIRSFLWKYRKNKVQNFRLL